MELRLRILFNKEKSTFFSMRTDHEKCLAIPGSVRLLVRKRRWKLTYKKEVTVERHTDEVNGNKKRDVTREKGNRQDKQIWLRTRGDTLSMCMGNEIYLIQNKLTAASGSCFIAFYSLECGPEEHRNWSAEFRGNPLTLSGISYTSLCVKLSMRCQIQRQPNKFHFCYIAFENTVCLS